MSEELDFSRSLMDVYEEITYLPSTDSDIKRENANIDSNTPMGVMLKYGSEGAKRFNLERVIPEEYMTLHKEGDIHIHDLDFYTQTTTCCQIDLLKLFHGGFHTGHGFIREPNGIASYAALACIAIQSNQNDQHGGQSIVNFDYAMAEGIKKTYIKELKKVLYVHFPFEREINEIGEELKWYVTSNASILDSQNRNYIKRLIDKHLNLSPLDPQLVHDIFECTERFTDEATYQAMESVIHNLNTMHSRAGAQVPFSSLNYGMCTTPEGRMVIKNILLATEAGLGNGETPIFPIQIFRVKEGVNFNEGEPNYDLFKLACRVSAKRLFPNFSFLDAPFNAQYYKGTPETEIAYMGCRTRVIGNTYDPEKEVSNGRGNLSFTSINLPRLGIESDTDVELFFRKLEELMYKVKGQLLHRLGIQSKKHVYNYPFLMGNGVWIDSEKLDADDEVGEVLKHGSLSIGFIGLAECLHALIGEHHGESEEAQELGLKIVGFMRDKCDEFSKETGLNFTCFATPAEGLSGRFIALDQKRYGIIEGVTDKEYYTNSFHIPVYYNISIMRKIALEAPYHALTNAGHISYVELDGDPLMNLRAFEDIVRYMKEQGIGYGSINHPVDRDPVCGYTGVIYDVCPRCGRREGEPIDLKKLFELRKIYPNMPKIYIEGGECCGN